MLGKSRFLTTIVVLSLLGCASNQSKSHEIVETFVTDIKEDGSKRFSFSLTASSFQQNGDGKMGQGGHGRGDHSGQGMGRHGAGRSGRGSMGGQNKEMIYEKLESKLSETGYCRDGYIELDFYRSRGQSQIKGECNEDATDLDRKTFAVNKAL